MAHKVESVSVYQCIWLSRNQKTLESGWAFVLVTDETVLQRSNSVRSNDGVAECGCLGLSSSVYDHTEIRNNRGGKQPAVAQLVKISRARND